MTGKKGIFIRFNTGDVSRLYVRLLNQRDKAERDLQVYQTREKLIMLGSLTDSIDAIRFLMASDDEGLQLN